MATALLAGCSSGGGGGGVGQQSTVTVDAGPDQSVQGFGVNAKITAATTFLGTTIVNYLWEQVGGPAVTLSGADTSTVSFSVDTADGKTKSVTLRVTVTGADGAKASDEVSVTLAPDLPAKPVPTVAYDIKTLKFSWSAVPATSHYQLFENADGVSGFVQVGSDILAPTASADRSVGAHVQNYTKALYMVRACNDTGCTDSSSLPASSGILRTVGFLKASNARGSDFLGYINAMAISGDGTTIAVGAPYEDSDARNINTTPAGYGATDSGAVYVYSKDSTGWAQRAYIKSFNSDLGDQFGTSVALNQDGTVLAVGAPFEDSRGIASNLPGTASTGNDTGSSDSGAVYIYNRSASGNSWSYSRYIKASNTGQNDQFGSSVSLSDDGKTLAVGAVGEGTATNAEPFAGAVYVYVYEGISWTLYPKELRASNVGRTDNFGASVALSGDGNTLAVGAPAEDSNGIESNEDALDSGAAYIFRRSNGAWTQQKYLKAPAQTLAAGDYFGRSIALSRDGNVVIVGAPFDDGNGSFQNGTSTATTKGADFAGAAYVFRFAANSWSAGYYLKATNTGTGDQFGYAVDVSADGNYFSVGAPTEKSTSIGINGSQGDGGQARGAVYTYRYQAGLSGPYVSGAYVKPSFGVSDGSNFGDSVTLSEDGATMAVAASSESRGPVAVTNQAVPDNTNAPGSGAVFLY